MNKIPVCSLGDLSTGNVQVVEVEGQSILVVQIDEEYFAIESLCSHADISLESGEIDERDRTIECPKHGSLFSLETGEALTLPAIKPVKKFPVSLDGENVVIEL